MKQFVIHYIDGHTMRYNSLQVTAATRAEAIHAVWAQDPSGDFDHQILEVREHEATFLQGYGWSKAKPARDLNTGDLIRWNFNYKSRVLQVVASASGKTISATLESLDSGKVSVRRLGADRLVAVV